MDIRVGSFQRHQGNLKRNWPHHTIDALRQAKFGGCLRMSGR